MNGCQITFFTHRDKRHQGSPLAEWLLQVAREMGPPGATLIAVTDADAEPTALTVKGFPGVVSDWLGKRKPLAVLGYGLDALSRPLVAPGWRSPRSWAGGRPGCDRIAAMQCILDAWQAHEAELRRFIRFRTSDGGEADDLLQDVFLRALRQPNGLCGIGNRRAWLFQTARNLMIDRLRLSREQVPLPDDLAAEEAAGTEPVDDLSQCLPRALAELSPEDREALTLCDLEGMTQQAYAARLGLTLPAAKSRVQRARARLRAQLTAACQVRFDEAGRVCCFVPRTD